MHQQRTVRALAALMGGVCLGWAGSAAAVLYGSPTRPYGPGRYSVGLDYSDHERDGESEGGATGTIEATRTTLRAGVGVGLGPGGEFGVQVGGVSGKVEGGSTESGQEYGASYHQKLALIDGVQEEVFLNYRYSYVDYDNSSDELEVWQYDLGFGVGKELQEGLSIYAGGVVSQMDATFYGARDVDFEQEDLLGVYGGAEYRSAQGLGLGAEVHLVHETAFGLTVDYRF